MFIRLSTLVVILAQFVSPIGVRAQDAVAGGGSFNNTGSNTCTGPIVVPVAVGPVGSPLITTITGDNSTATGPDCRPPFGFHIGPTWWEAFQINQTAMVTIDLCGTNPVQDPSYSVIYHACGVASQFCVNAEISDESGRGAPYCADNNIWSQYLYLNPGTYRLPILSDPAVLVGGLGPYEIHIHASACPGACCHTSQITCDDCADPATCTGPGDVFHAGQSCLELECASTIGPDVVVGIVWDCEHLGRVGPIGSGTVAMSCNTTACNKGDKKGNWFALPDTDHPVIGVNMYRKESVDGATRFEQIGYSWLKHGFGSANADECGFGCVPGAPFEQIGIGCSDTYSGLQFESCNLGPRSMIHPFTGEMPGGPALGPMSGCGPFTSDPTHFPANDHRDHVHSPISHKVQVPEADFDPTLHPGAQYFAEGFYIAPHEYNQGNGNQNNNVSHVELAVTGPDGAGEYNYQEINTMESESPALDAWTGASQTLIEPAPFEDGRAFLAWEATDLGGGQWHYEYAVYNMNLDKSVGSLCIPLAPGATVSNVGFHAPLNHAPELHADNYTNDPWTPTITSEAIRWDTESFEDNPMANAVRFGTLYNFRFDANVAPQSVAAVVGLFKTGAHAAALSQGPSPVVVDDINLNGIPDACEGPVAPAVQSDTTGLSKARFISFTVPQSNVAGVLETALRVKMVSLHHVVPPYSGGPSLPFASFEGQVRWVGPPVQYVESSATPTPFHASNLQCDPHYRDWSTIPLLHVTGSAIVPSSVYEVHNVPGHCMGTESNCSAVSAPISVSTTRWGDVTDPYNPPSTTVQPDIGDIGSLVNKFRNAPGSPIKARGLLAGEPGNTFGEITPVVLSLDLGFSHISASVDAFRGVPYPYTISSCP